MPDYLNEDHFSVGSALTFPNVQSCMAVIATSTLHQGMAGFHATLLTTADEFMSVGRRMTGMLGGRIDRLFLVGNVAKRSVADAGDPRTVFGAPLRSTLREAFGYRGRITYEDTDAYRRSAAGSGVAVRTSRGAANNQLRIVYALPGAWNTGAGVPCSQFQFRVQSGNGAVRILPPRAVLHVECAMTAVTELNLAKLKHL
ncbi:hypothetical protein [Roseomonas sp. BN140053]|uniref:hypothetical protein n=1 Tax=Roseomonas sp. BN140053 TaxID=3391898 RepID=UPI0039ED75FF